MTEINIPARAKGLYIEGERQDKYGQRKPSKVKLHQFPAKGMYSAKEMEQMIPEYAQQYGVSEDRVKLETYERGDAPLESNPRHRGGGMRWERPKGTREVEYKDRPIRVRRVFAGGTPQTPEEWEQHVADFYARKESQNNE